MSQRAEAVMKAMNDVCNIMEDRDRRIAITNYFLQTDPQLILEDIRAGRMNSNYTADLFIVLTRLYDEGYANASEDLETFK